MFAEKKKSKRASVFAATDVFAATENIPLWTCYLAKAKKIVRRRIAKIVEKRDDYVTDQRKFRRTEVRHFAGRKSPEGQ